MTGRLKDKVAIVTGGASSMGRASVEMYLREEARVVIADLNAATGAEVVAQAKKDGFGDTHVQYIKADVSDEGQLEVMNALTEKFGKLDTLLIMQASAVL